MIGIVAILVLGEVEVKTEVPNKFIIILSNTNNNYGLSYSSSDGSVEVEVELVVVNVVLLVGECMSKSSSRICSS